MLYGQDSFSPPPSKYLELRLEGLEPSRPETIRPKLIADTKFRHNRQKRDEFFACILSNN